MASFGIVKGICMGYCLCCVHYGRIAPRLFGVPQQAKPCRVCGRIGQYLTCIATPTNERPDLSVAVSCTDGAKRLEEESSPDQYII